MAMAGLRHESQRLRLESNVNTTIAILAVGSVLSCCGRNETNQLWKPSRLRPALSRPEDRPNSAVPVFPAIQSFALGIGAWLLVTTLRAPSRIVRRSSGFIASLR